MSEEFFRRIKNNEAKIDGFAYKTTLNRVWGSTVALDANTRINHLIGEPSVHFHKNRVEEYILLSGKMLVYKGTLHEDMEKTIAALNETLLLPGDKITIPEKTVHIPINLAQDGSTFIEVSHGVYDDEDAYRVYDKTGREPELAKKWTELGYPAGMSIQELVPIAKLKVSKAPEWPYSEEGAKVVMKPWGKEIWLNYRAGEEVGDKEKKYVFKKIYVNAGTRMSFQHHEKKKEVNFLISGKVEAWLENDKGEIEKKIVTGGSIWEIHPPQKHRMIAIEDSILLECSTPEVDDVVRHQDDSGRGDGRIQTEHIQK